MAGRPVLPPEKKKQRVVLYLDAEQHERLRQFLATPDVAAFVGSTSPNKRDHHPRCQCSLCVPPKEKK